MAFGVSERRACQVAQIARTTKRRPSGRIEEAKLVRRIHELSEQYPRYVHAKIPTLRLGRNLGLARPSWSRVHSRNKNGPRNSDVFASSRGPFSSIPPSRYSPTQEMGSTIAEARLNFRVRNGNGCGPCSMDGGKTVFSFSQIRGS